MNEQTQQITRVRDAIASHVINFLHQREGKEFYNAELHQYISEFVTIAPGSGDRILRDLRKRGVVQYELVSRSRSLYRSVPVKGQLELF